MKILSVGDLHGLDIWKNINPKNYDKIIFIGDYVDSFTISDIEIKNNLLDIVQFKKDNSNKVILLLGNHDIQYIHYPYYICSGFRTKMLWEFSHIFQKNINLFQVSYQIKNYLWTHAGLSQQYFDNRIKEYVLEEEDKDLSDTLNKMYEHNTKELFDIGRLRGGENEFGGIFWADKQQTTKDLLKGYHQIVGHTPVQNIVSVNDNENTSITYIDTFSNKSKGEILKSLKFHELEI